MARPNTVTIKRRTGTSARSLTGAVGGSVTTLNVNVPATLQPALRGDVVATIDNQQYQQAALLILDGLGRADYAGVAPGGTLVVGGVTYTVAGNGRGAFPDVRQNDKVTDEAGAEYLVMSASVFEITRTLQAQLAHGRVWPG